MCPSSGSTGPSFTTNSSGLISPHPKRHFGRFIRFRRTHARKRQTQTNRPRYMCNSRLFLILCIAMWPKKYKVNESFWAWAALRALLGESTRYSESPAVGGREGHRSPSPSRRRSDARLDVRALTLYRAIAGHVDSSFRHSSIVFYRAMLCIRGTSHGPVSVRPSARLSVTSRCSTKTAKRRITQTTPHDSYSAISRKRYKIDAWFTRSHGSARVL